MAAFKNKDNGTWYVQFRYTDWKGERQQKLKRGFATKREALEWEREFLMEKQADVNMTFESFVALYERDIKPKLKLNTWLTKESIIKKEDPALFCQAEAFGDHSQGHYALAERDPGDAGLSRQAPVKNLP